MRKRKLLIAFGGFGVVILAALVWLFVDLGTGSNDKARYRHLGRTARSYAWISWVHKRLPNAIGRRLLLTELEMKYQDRCEKDVDALIDSGYLQGTRFTVTNLAANRRQVHNAVADALKGTGYWGASLNIASNELTVYCRPQYVAQLRKALGQ